MSKYQHETAAQLWNEFTRHPGVNLTELARQCDHLERTRPEHSFTLPDTRSTQQVIAEERKAQGKRLSKLAEEAGKLIENNL